MEQLTMTINDIKDNAVAREFLTAPFVKPYAVKLALGWERYNGTLRGFEFKNSVCEYAEISRPIEHIKLRRFGLTASNLSIVFVSMKNKRENELRKEDERLKAFNARVNKANAELIDMSRRKIKPKDYKPNAPNDTATTRVLPESEEADITPEKTPVNSAKDAASGVKKKRGRPAKSKPTIKRGK